MIKRQLQLHMVGVRIFLDVDDLEVLQYVASLRCLGIYKILVYFETFVHESIIIV